MKKSYRRIGRMLAIFLAGAVFLNNESIYSVFAAESSIKAGSGNGEQFQPSDGGSETNQPAGSGDAGSQPPEGGADQTPETGTESGQPSGDGDGSNQPSGDGNESNQPSEDGNESNQPSGDGNESNQPSDDENGSSQPSEDGSESNQPSGDGNESSQPPEDGDGSNQPSGDGDESGQPPESGDGTEQPPKDGTEEDDLLPPEEGAEGDILDGADKDEPEDEKAELCLEGKEHEYEFEESLAEIGEEAFYRCVFCQRQIDTETFEEEGAVLHAHTWGRAEEELIPSCEACQKQRLDCEAEDGFGIHIFELVQEEGQPDKYRCAVCGEEKDALDEWDITLEDFQNIMGFSLYADPELGIPTLPKTKAEWDSFTNNTDLLIKNLADLLNLQQLSKEFDFKGVTVKFGYFNETTGSGGSEWDLRKLKDHGFVGLGTEDYPFRGTLCSAYSQSLIYKTNTPLLNYVAPGATLNDLNIQAEIEGDGSPVGAVASHVIRKAGDTADGVTMNLVTVSGAVKNSGGAAGGLFGEVKTENASSQPIKIRYGTAESVFVGIVDANGEARPIQIEGKDAGGITGRTEGAAEIYLTDIFSANPAGGLVTVTGTETAGMLAGSIGEGGTVYIKGIDGKALPADVKGSGISGGLAGRIEGGKIGRTDDGEDNGTLTITGSVEGSSAGGLAGDCIRTAAELNDITVEADVTGDGGNAGGAIGYVEGAASGTADSPVWDVLHYIRIKGNVRGTVSAGGAVGYLKSSNFRIGLPDGDSPFECIHVEAGEISASGSGSSAGGIIGTAEGEYIEIYHAQVSGGSIKAEAAGGMIGKAAEHSVIKVENAKADSRFVPGAAENPQGGILGNVLPGSMAALDGAIDVAGVEIEGDNTALQRGHIAGKQQEALVYFEENIDYKRPEGKGWVDDIGTYGGVYKNGGWGEGTAPLISYGQKQVTGTVGNNGGVWVLDSEADVMRLAIMLNTEGRLAANCFPGTGKNVLLGAGYLLQKAEYDLEGSGIYSLNRNDETGKSQSFTGSFSGTAGDKAVLKLGECMTYQSYLSLFPRVGSGASFYNLTVNRDIKYARGAAAGLAAYASDNLTVDNVYIEAALTGSALNSRYFYGGMFADYSAAPGTVLKVSNSRIGGSIRIAQEGVNQDGQKQYAGGLIAKYSVNGTGGSLPVIEIENLSIAGNIQSSSRFTSGMITEINENKQNVDRVVLKMNGISVENGAGLTITDAGGGSETGGFLGRMWFDVAPYTDGTESYSIKGLTVGSGGTAADGPAYSTQGSFGGMVHTVTGRIQLKDTKIQNGTFQVANSTHNGLLFHDGYDALIELEGYQIAGQEVSAAENNNQYPNTAGKVAVSGSTSNFSDIVGNNIGRNSGDGVGSYEYGGIVNIISPAFESGFMVYSKHPFGSDGGSAKTRYYYNLFGDSLAGESAFLSGAQMDASGGSLVIRNADEMMLWHLSQYMNDSIRKYLAPYFAGGSLPNRGSNQVTIEGLIDLTGKSYYPTPVSGGIIEGINQAEVRFYGDKIMEGLHNVVDRSPRNTREHYMMHSGLLVSPSGNVTVQGGNAGDDEYLTLSGMVSHISNHSGALFVRTITGTKKIYKIKLKDCYLQSYGGLVHGYGLLIGGINNGSDVDISWIKTEGYENKRQDLAGAALIGRVGSVDADNIRLEFTNIYVADKTPENGGIFKFATLIDDYQYTDSTEINKGYTRYLFTEEAYKGIDKTGSTIQREPFIGGIHGDNNYGQIGKYVTLGKELKDGVEYWNVDGEEADFLLDGPYKIPDSDWEKYLPYVCNSHNSKDIEVNPKNVGITEGCGTYEDPYQITSAKQLLALSRYFISGEGKNEQYLREWTIRKPGFIVDADSDGICDKTHEEDDLVQYESAEFPSPDELRQAYYMIMNDIDFSGLRSTTDKGIAMDFVGLGTTKYPFSGVIIGKKDDNGEYPTVTLPYKRADSNSCANFGLIQYAKGAVAKDFNIVSPKLNEGDETTNVTRVENNGGTVMACILGGDNIIDNIHVESMLAVREWRYDNGNAAVGGYVGTVQQGSLILRNLKQENLENFRCGILNNNAKAMTEIAEDKIGNIDGYPYISGAIGKVENGFVVYDDKSNAYGGVILPHEGKTITGSGGNVIYQHARFPFSNTYDVITASGMQGETVKIRRNGGNYSFICNVENAKQLQLVSMAINSDSFSIWSEGGGYDVKAVCRKAAYDMVGSDELQAGGNMADYEKATQWDNKIYWYPYIYQYVTFDGYTFEGSPSGEGVYHTILPLPQSSADNPLWRSKLNAVTNDVNAVMSYELVHNNPSQDISVVDYDLSVYKRGFRGLGATYRIFRDGVSANFTESNGVYSDFRANFDGHGATVKAEMVNDYAKDIHTAALFNDLIRTGGRNSYGIKNLVVTGTFHSSNAKAGYSTVNYHSDRAAALVGMMRRPWKIENITVLDADVWGIGYTAGVTAWINPKKGANSDYSFTGCQVMAKNKETVIHTMEGSNGGMIGIMTAREDGDANGVNYKLTLSGCKIKGAAGDKRVNITNQYTRAGLNAATEGHLQESDGRGRSGGFIGHAGKHWEDRDNIEIIIRGENGAGVTSANPDVEYVYVSGMESTGGIIGEYYGMQQNGKAPSITISDIAVSNSIIESPGSNEKEYGSFGIGGIIGKLQREAVVCGISNVKVADTSIRSVYGGEGAVSVTGAAPKGDLHAGGIIGYCYWKSQITMENVEVTGVLKADGQPEYEISSRLSGAGGLIGASWNGSDEDSDRSHVTVNNVKVLGMRIVSDSRSKADRDADKASGASDGAAGGIIGFAAMMEAFELNGAEIKDCVIRSGKGSVGGIVGGASGKMDTDLESASVMSCTIGSNGSISGINEAAGAGGIYGSIDGLQDAGSQKLCRISVSQCTVYGKNTGGIAGAAGIGRQIGNIWSSEDKNREKITVNNNQLLGDTAGGVFGQDKSKRSCFVNVEVTGNVIAALGNGTGYSAAGGFCGRKENSGLEGDSHTLNAVTVENNRIFANNLSDASKQGAGGIFGCLGLTQEVYSYEAKVKDNHIGYWEVPDSIKNTIFAGDVSSQLSNIKAGFAVAGTQTAKLWDGDSGQFTELPATLKEEDIGNYAMYFGNLIGIHIGKDNKEGHAYFLKPTVDYKTDIATRPTVDAGSLTAAADDKEENKNRMFSFPYGYRENIHAVYYEPDASAGNTAAAVWGSTSLGSGGLFSQVNAEEKLKEYKEIEGKDADAAKLLDAYRLGIINDSGYTVPEIYHYVYQDETVPEYISSLTVNEAGGRVKLPLIDVDMQYGTIDQLLGGVVAALTDVGGIFNSGSANSIKNDKYDAGIGRIMEISAEAKKVEGGIIKPKDGKSSIRIANNYTDNKRWEVSYNGYDTVDENGDGTFSMITVTYRQEKYMPIDGGGLADGEAIVLQIPVFVEERLTIDTHLKMLEGEVYNAEKAKEEGAYRRPVLASDSSYTLYMEYIYGGARYKYSTDSAPIYVDKKLEMTKQDSGRDTFWKGTRLTLVDVCDSDKVYYYTVTGDNEEVISFDQFKDENGMPYQYRQGADGNLERNPDKAIHVDKGKEIYTGENEEDAFETVDDMAGTDGKYQYWNSAVEKFLIIVDTSGAEKKLDQPDIRYFHAKPEVIFNDGGDSNIEARTTVEERTNLQVTRQPALDISLLDKGKENGTDIRGILQDGEEVTIDAAFEVKGDELYWNRVLNGGAIIDSANTDKYLEVGIYLTDSNDNRVRLPDNTNVTVNGHRVNPKEEVIKEEENLGAYVNRTEVYFYKDGKISFPMNSLKEIIREEYQNRKYSVEDRMKIVLNFANADLSDYTESQYRVHIELLRTENKDYPAGGEIIDTHSGEVNALIKNDLACALETKDLMELGINTYQNQTPMPHEIDFGFKLDFNGIIRSNQAMNEQLIVNKYYTVTYHILEKKIKDGVQVYEPYTGSQLALQLNSPPASDIQTALAKGASSTGNFNNSQYVTYKFGWNEISKGTGGIEKGVITRDLVLTVKDASKMDLSNYKIVASVMVSDDRIDDIGTEVNPALSDFFVFTVAKLKTDLDY